MDSKSKNDNLKRLFSDEDANLPQEFNWEQMEDGILDKMNSLESTPPPFSRRAWRVIVALALLMIILPVSNLMDNRLEYKGGLGTQDQKTGPGISQSNSPSSPNLMPTQPSVDDTQLSVQTDKGQSTNNISEENISEISSNRLPNSIEQDRIQAFVDTDFQNDLLRSDKVTRQDDIQSNSDNLNKQQSNIADNPVNPEINASSSETSEFKQMMETLISFEQENPYIATPLLPVIAYNTVYSNRSTKEKLEFLIANEPIKKRRKSSLPSQELSLVSGASVWSMGYGSELPERQPYEQTLLSYHAQLMYNYRSRNNLTLTTGLQYQQLETRLDWSKRLEDYTIVIQDTIIEIQANSLTGEKSEIRGDAEVPVDATRNVRHFNRYRVFQVPVAIGKSWKLAGNWYASISIGAAVNIYGYNNGRNVRQGILEDFNSSSTLFMDSRWNLHGLAMAKIGYRINNKWGILAQADMQKSLTNWSKESNIQMKPEIINFGIGLYYAL